MYIQRGALDALVHTVHTSLPALIDAMLGAKPPPGVPRGTPSAIYMYIYTLCEPRRGHSQLIGHEDCLCCFDAFGGLALGSCVWSLAGA